MSDDKTPIIDADKVEGVQSSAEESAKEEHQEEKPVKKSRFKFHLFLMLVLALGTWVFWTFSPAATPWKEKLSHYFPQLQQSSITDNISTPIEENPKDETSTIDSQADNTAEQNNVIDEYANHPLSSTPVFEPQPELPTIDEVPPSNEESIANNNTDAFEQLQNQIGTLQNSIITLQQQQVDLVEQQVASLMYFYLQTAASTQSSFTQQASAWKAVAILPLLEEDRRDIAKQAAHALDELQNNLSNINRSIDSTITELATQLQPEDLADVADTVENLVDTYSQADTFTTWVDWLKNQFRITKVHQRAITISDDPYADIKALMTQLHQLKTNINQAQWDNIQDLDALIYQLEQHGVALEFSSENVQALEETYQTWRNEAQAWVEMSLL